MRVLVCGGRHFDNASLLNRTLDETHLAGPITVLIHGLAKGADTLAAEWAARNNVATEGYLADWKKYRKSAGPIRNARMLRADPKIVIAFKGGRGTADMVRQARAAFVPVMVIDG